MKDNTNPFRDFPHDLILASGIPIVLMALGTSWLLSLHGWRWIIAFSTALLIAFAGTAYLFRAKLPLYREGRFFTFGSRGLPETSILLYRRGCRLSIAGILLACLLLLGASFWRGV